MKRRGIKAIRHLTFDVGSDHDFVGVEFVIVNQDAVTIRAGVINLGKADVHKVLGTILPGLRGRGILVVVEAGGQLEAIEDEAHAHQWRVLSRTNLPGSASTLVLVGWRVNTQRAWIRRLLRRQFVGRGAGPGWNKPKYASGGRVCVDGVVFGVSAVHFLASQQHHRRLAYSLRMARLLTAITVDRRVPWLVGGDFNSDLGGKKIQPLARWMLAHGWVSNHTALGALGTHGKRAIDGYMWRKTDDLRG